MRIAFLIASAVALSVSASAQLQEFEGLTYAQYGSRELKLDLFKPAEQNNPLPAIVCIHGGGWRNGTGKGFNRIAKYFAERGYVAVSISYRLSGEAPFPAQIQDCKAAVRWLRANAERYGINPDRIGATGHSAGGHLAALLGTSAGVTALEGDGGNGSYSSAVQAVVPTGAQTDLETDRIRSMTAQEGAGIWHDFLGGSLDEEEANYQLASPRRHLDDGDPPMFFITGGLDNLDTQALPIRSDMRRLKIPSGILVIPGAGHNFLRDEGWFQLGLSAAVAFFDRHL